MSEILNLQLGPDTPPVKACISLISLVLAE